MEIIDFNRRKVPASYLGDGVYAIFDGFGIWLHANDHKYPTDKVYLEPTVLRGLIKFEEESKTKEVIELCKQQHQTKQPQPS